MKREVTYDEVKDNFCEVCGKKPARASIYEYKRKGKDPELPILHYSCLNHVLDLYNKTEHKFVQFRICVILAQEAVTRKRKRLQQQQIIILPTSTTKLTKSTTTTNISIHIGDKFLACVASNDLRPSEGQECEKRILKKFEEPNVLYAR